MVHRRRSLQVSPVASAIAADMIRMLSRMDDGASHRRFKQRLNDQHEKYTRYEPVKFHSR
jgi:hypothetical protein